MEKHFQSLKPIKLNLILLKKKDSNLCHRVEKQTRVRVDFNKDTWRPLLVTHLSTASELWTLSPRP